MTEADAAEQIIKTGTLLEDPLEELIVCGLIAAPTIKKARWEKHETILRRAIKGTFHSHGLVVVSPMETYNVFLRPRSLRENDECVGFRGEYVLANEDGNIVIPARGSMFIEDVHRWNDPGKVRVLSIQQTRDMYQSLLHLEYALAEQREKAFNAPRLPKSDDTTPVL